VTNRWVCFSCNKKGHTSKMCRSKSVNSVSSEQCKSVNSVSSSEQCNNVVTSQAINSISSSSVIGLSINENGLLLSLPYLLMWIVAITSGYFVDWLLTMEFLGVTSARRIFTTVASVGPALGILGAMYSECNRGSATAFFIIGMGFMGFFYPSLKVNALDLSPNFAGTISALVIGIGAISGILTPYLVGLLTPDSTLMQWKKVFWIAIAVLVGTNMVYIVLGSGEVQPWNLKEQEEKGGKKPAAGPQSLKSDDGFQSIQLMDSLEKVTPQAPLP